MEKFLRFLIKLLVLKLVLLAILYAVIFLPEDKILIARLADHLTRETDYHVEITGLDGDIFSHITADDVQISDGKGIWFSATKIHLAWHPLGFATGGHILDRIKADTINLPRIPSSFTEETTTTEPTDWASLLRYVPFDITLPFIQLEQGLFKLYLHPASKDTERALQIAGPGITVNGNGQWSPHPFAVSGDLVIDISDITPLTKIFALPVSGAIHATAHLATSDKSPQADIAIDKLDLSYEKNKLHLRQPVQLTLHEQTIILSPALFDLAGGTVSTNFTASPEKVDGTVQTRNIRLDRLLNSDAFQAKTAGRLTISGTLAQPVADLQATITGQSADHPVTLKINSQWRDNALHLKADGQSGRKTNARLEATLPATISLWPFATDLSTDTALQGAFNARMDLSVFNPVLWASRQQIDGDISGKMTIGGTVGQPVFNGRFDLAHGDYLHSPSGVCLRDIRATLTGDGQQITLRDLSSRNGPKGSLQGTAKLRVTKENPINSGINGNITFHDYRLFCGGPATGELNGRLGIGGSVKALTIGGKLILGPLNVQLPGAGGNSDIPEIETRRMNETRSVSNTPTTIRLQISLAAPNRIFVRGRGLDAEFGGDVAVTGLLSDLSVNGAFNARRGRFALLDRTLTLSNAALRFEGHIPPSPFLDIQAASTVKSTKVTVSLDGPAAKPALTLSSQPALPQDELLALLLFGRQLQNISPFEALKLAQAARTLAGLDGGQPSAIDQARAKLGLDTLDVGTNAQNDMTVSTGKYITDTVYVGVQQGARPEDKQVKTEIELAPSVSANTTIDAQGNQGVGLGWRHDY